MSVQSKALPFEEARTCVLEHVRGLNQGEQVALVEQVGLDDACGRVLAEAIAADRDYPPFDRSARDGFAVHASEVPGTLKIAGEIRAGDAAGEALQHGAAIEIMTGAPMPAGADAVVMVEHTLRVSSDAGDRVVIERSINVGENFTPRGTEAKRGSTVLERGRRIGYAEIALLAMVGRACVPVFARPRVAIVPTGDEIVAVDEQPGEFQIRNSNAWSIAAQVRRAGAIPQVLAIARDEYAATRSLIEQALQDSDLLLLSGGVSAGKYDIVERVLADLGARFFFDRVAIQPGQPAVFGSVVVENTQEKFFFGLPGNPISTMITFELFARAAIDRLSGCADAPLPLLRAKLTRDFKHKPGLTRFLPAILSENGAELTPVAWHGSGDVPAAARANAFLVADADRDFWRAGEDIRVLLR